jgi:hypothetical protein
MSGAIDDPVLGRVTFNSEEGGWVCTLGVHGRKVEFDIGGDGAPEPALLSAARQIFENFEAFRERVHGYLDRRAREMMDAPEVASEIRSLQIETVMLAWPDQPNHGMIFFSGSTDERLWHCDLVDGELTGLACDT